MRNCRVFLSYGLMAWREVVSYGLMAWWKVVAIAVTSVVMAVVDPPTFGQRLVLAAMAWASTYVAANLACAAERRRLVRKARRCGYDV